MDKTETYIKMCDCDEIQGLRTIAINYGGNWPKKWDVEGHSISTIPEDIPDNFQDGDIIVLDGEVYIIGTSIYHPQRWVYPDETGRYELPLVGYDEGDGITYTSLVWLPRQDQLQEMVIDIIDCSSHSATANLINFGTRLQQFVKDDYDYWMQFTSMEQLWLAFVMKEKYNKTWNGEKWVETRRD